MKTVVIIGGGASGMMAALSAAEDPENRIILLERQQRIGRKLLATGNGRCNLTNVGAAPENYHGEQPDFAVPALESFPPEKVLEFSAGWDFSRSRSTAAGSTRCQTRQTASWISCGLRLSVTTSRCAPRVLPASYTETARGSI